MFILIRFLIFKLTISIFSKFLEDKILCIKIAPIKFLNKKIEFRKYYLNEQ